MRVWRSRDYCQEHRFETNMAAHRKLDAELHDVDVHLQWWGKWAKDRYSELGFPTRAVTEKVNEGGILARDACPVHAPEWPSEVVLVEKHVAALPTRHLAAVMATYFHMALRHEDRAEIYVRYAKWLARTRSNHIEARRRRESLGLGAFRQDLDRARWTLKYALGL